MQRKTKLHTPFLQPTDVKTAQCQHFPKRPQSFGMLLNVATLNAFQFQGAYGRLHNHAKFITTEGLNN